MERMPKILIVDDETDICDMIVFSFKSRGFATYTAHDAETAFAIAKEVNLDIVISDIKMPGGGGLKLLEDLQNLTPKPKVFLITGYSDFPPERIVAMGAEGILSKPLKLKELVQTISRALGLEE